jgi:hypothetical protein
MPTIVGRMRAKTRFMPGLRKGRPEADEAEAVARLEHGRELAQGLCDAPDVNADCHGSGGIAEEAAARYGTAIQQMLKRMGAIPEGVNIPIEFKMP